MQKVVIRSSAGRLADRDPTARPGRHRTRRPGAGAGTAASRRAVGAALPVAERLSNKEIAGRLYVSLRTVKSHALKIYQKLHVNGRRGAVEKAVALGLLPER